MLEIEWYIMLEIEWYIMLEIEWYMMVEIRHTHYIYSPMWKFGEAHAVGN
jgi:hypothetical protein